MSGLVGASEGYKLFIWQNDPNGVPCLTSAQAMQGFVGYENTSKVALRLVCSLSSGLMAASRELGKFYIRY